MVSRGRLWIRLRTKETQTIDLQIHGLPSAWDMCELDDQRVLAPRLLSQLFGENTGRALLHLSTAFVNGIIGASNFTSPCLLKIAIVNLRDVIAPDGNFQVQDR